MAIGLTARQKADLAAMLPHIDESVAGLKRLIADTKDRARALQKLSDAEEAQKRHASEVGIPFNADAFARRRAELDALPKSLTVEEGQLSAFTQLQRAAGIVLDGPYERAGRGGGKSAKPAKKGAKTASKRAPNGARKAGAKAGSKGRDKSKAPGAGAGAKKPAPVKRSLSVARGGAKSAPSAAPKAPVARVAFQKPLPLALGS